MLTFAHMGLACDCANLTLEERVQYADVIFVGTVTEFEVLQKVSFDVDEVFKGDIETDQAINFPGHSDCDYFLPSVDPELGDQFLIFGVYEDFRGEPELLISRCLESAPIEDSEEALAYLQRDKTRGSMIPCTTGAAQAAKRH